jgi:hypothetical protein
VRYERWQCLRIDANLTISYLGGKLHCSQAEAQIIRAGGVPAVTPAVVNQPAVMPLTILLAMRGLAQRFVYRQTPWKLSSAGNCYGLLVIGCCVA